MATDERLEDPPSGRVLRFQREANEKLVIAGLRAQEAADDAVEATRQAQEETRGFREREEELRATAELRERLIGIIGHDLRSPLNTMVVAADLLIARGMLDDDDMRLANRITTSGHRMGRMIGQLVEFTRARLGGGFALNLLPADLGDICHDIVDELRISGASYIEQRFSGDLTGVWDSDRLGEVISNLASNALAHGAPGTPIVIDARDDGPQVVVEVTNHGACIPPELLPDIFKAFRRTQDSTRGSGHLGLGLYIACELVRGHGGTLEVRSSDGTTSFTMRLPRVSTTSRETLPDDK
jgi:signal transduction histidine kinase